MVITAGRLIQFKGWARINGVNGNWFFVKAIDNGEPDVGVDTFEIRTWAPGVSPEGMWSERVVGVLRGGDISVKR